MNDKPTIELNELKLLLKSIDREKPDPQAVAELHKHLDAMPRLCTAMGDTGAHLQNQLIERLSPFKSAQIAIEKQTEAVRDGLGYQGAPQLEQLLINHTVLCWLRLQDVESSYSYAMQASLPLSQADYWDRHLSAAQRRYLRAIETLARVRRLLNPTLQVNIAAEGGRQLNVSGDLHLPPGPTSAAPAPGDPAASSPAHKKRV